jgi:acyl carrier protein
MSQMQSTSETVEERVRRVISTSRRLPFAAVQPCSSLEELGIDSLDRLNILFDLESEFGLDIPDAEAKQATVVKEIIDGLEKLLETSGSPHPAS